MGHGPSDMISEWQSMEPMWFVYDAEPFGAGAHWGEEDPRRPSEYGLQPRFDVDAVEAEIKRLWKMQQDAKERIGGEPWERDDRSGVRHYLYPWSYFEVHPDGFITTDSLQAYSYFNDGIAVSAEDWIRHKITTAEHKADEADPDCPIAHPESARA